MFGYVAIKLGKNCGLAMEEFIWEMCVVRGWGQGGGDGVVIFVWRWLFHFFNFAKMSAKSKFVLHILILCLIFNFEQTNTVVCV